MPKVDNKVWRFFASVKLALITLIILAIVSIAGTIIKQGQAPSFYVEEYGASAARLLEMTDLTNMYSSWWFSGLLCLFALNLVICSIERLPRVWRTVFQDNLAVEPSQIERMGLNQIIEFQQPESKASEHLVELLSKTGWGKPQQNRQEGRTIFFVQKGAWSRLGVYVVHFSILVILAGVLVGNLLGFQAFVFLPEGRFIDSVFLRGSNEPYPLGFQLQCNQAEKVFYPNGMIKQYRANLQVNDNRNQSPLQKTVIVNDPLSYRGLTFYLGDSLPLEEFFVVTRNVVTGREQAFRIPPNRDVNWQGTDVTFRIDELQTDEEGTLLQAKIKFATGPQNEPAVFLIKDKDTVTFRQGQETYAFSLRQLSSLLLLVTKDPGVLVVYAGFILMVIGLAISFFVSHRRIWAVLDRRGDKGSQVWIGGATNKHRPAFEDRFGKLVELLEAETKKKSAGGKITSKQPKQKPGKIR